MVRAQAAVKRRQWCRPSQRLLSGTVERLEPSKARTEPLPVIQWVHYSAVAAAGKREKRARNLAENGVLPAVGFSRRRRFGWAGVRSATREMCARRPVRPPRRVPRAPPQPVSKEPSRERTPTAVAGLLVPGPAGVGIDRFVSGEHAGRGIVFDGRNYESEGQSMGRSRATSGRSSPAPYGEAEAAGRMARAHARRKSPSSRALVTGPIAPPQPRPRADGSSEAAARRPERRSATGTPVGRQRSGDPAESGERVDDAGDQPRQPVRAIALEAGNRYTTPLISGSVADRVDLLLVGVSTEQAFRPSSGVGNLCPRRG